MTTRKEPPADDAELIDQCRAQAVALLERNLSAYGILAATPGARASERGYSAVFARDAGVCALGMALSGALMIALIWLDWPSLQLVGS